MQDRTTCCVSMGMGGWNPCITGAPHLHPHCHLPHLLSLTVLSLHWHCLSAPSVCTSLCCLSMPSFCISLHCLCASLCHLLYAVSLHLLMPSLCLPTLSLCTISLHCLSVPSPYTISLHHLSTPSVCTSLCCLSHSLPLSACHLSVPPSLLCCLPCYAASLTASCCLPLFPCSLPSLCAVSPTVLFFSSHHLPHHAVSLAISLISPAASSHHLAPLSHHLSPCCLLLPPLSHH